MHEQPAVPQLHHDRLLQSPCGTIHAYEKLTEAALPGLTFVVGDIHETVGERRGGDAVARIPVFRLAAGQWADPAEGRRQQPAREYRV